MKFRWRSVNLLVVLLSVLLLPFAISCSRDSDEDNGSDGNGVTETEPPEEQLPPLEGEPTVTLWDWEQAQQAIQTHSGKVVVLHVWALWNEDLKSPDVSNKSDREKKEKMLAKAGFDEFVRLKKLHRDDVIALSLNSDPESLKDNVRQFVEERGANFPHGIATVPEEELYYVNLEIPNTPATLVYDKSGTLRKKFTYDLDKDEWYSYRNDVIPFVEQLIAEKYEAPQPTAQDEKPTPDARPNSEESAPVNETTDCEEKSDNLEANPTEKVSVQIDNWEGLQKRVAKAKGRVVVVDLWSTQCVPCIKEFPNLVKLHNERKADVACLSFNLDYYGIGEPAELKPDVLDVLKKLNATLPNVMSNVADETVYEQLKLASIPAVYVYDRKGKLRKRFEDTQGQFTYEKDILPLVETLIKEKK